MISQFRQKTCLLTNLKLGTSASFNTLVCILSFILGLETYENIGHPRRVKGDIDGVKIVDIASRSDAVLALSESGEVFGWGNSEYSQLSLVTSETQVSVPRHLPIKCGRITAVATGGSICAILNGRCSY